MNIDRTSQRSRPTGSPNGYQRWQSLLFLHWPVPVELLRPQLPESLEVDLYDGIAYVGVVPFAMRQIRPSWCPASLGLNFLELNLRTYVHDGKRAGVYFFSLDASSRLAVWVARNFWGLPYYNATMKMSDSRSGGTGSRYEYESVRANGQARFEVSYEVGKELAAPQPGSLEYFFLERYLLFTEYKNAVQVGQVHHIPYPAFEAKVHRIAQGLLAAHQLGTDWSEPPYAHYSPGVDVEVFSLQPLS